MKSYVVFGLMFFASGLFVACDEAELLTVDPDSIDIVNVDITPHPLGLSRLSSHSYIDAVKNLLGDDIVIAQQLEVDLVIEGSLAFGSADAALSAFGVEGFEAAAFEAAKQAFDSETSLQKYLGCGAAESATFDAACAKSGLAKLAEIAWRKQITDEDLNGSAEITGIVEVAEMAALAMGVSEPVSDADLKRKYNFLSGIEFAVAYILQSPNFLYRVEIGETDPADESRLRFTNYEMATRLAHFMWNTVPDEALIQEARDGNLVSTASLTKVIDKMKDDRRARNGIRAFFSDMLQLHHLEDLSKDPTKFEHFNADIGPDAKQETLSLIEDIVFDKQESYLTLFTTRESFINRRLAAIYAVPAPSQAGFAKVTMPANGVRAGLLGHISILAAHSHPRDSSATLRGRFIRETLLCGRIPPPPAGVDTSIPEPDSTSPTLRERVATHLSVPLCASCHASMDPIGLGLETFDALGRYRPTQEGARIDPSGQLDGEHFDDAVDLGRRISEHSETSACLVRHMMRYATQHKEGRNQRLANVKLTEAFEASDHAVLDLMGNIAKSPVFRYASTPTDTAE